MFRLALLILMNLGRNRARTIVTGVAIMVLVALYTMMNSVVGSVDELVQSEAGKTRIVVSERWQLLGSFPRRYVERIARDPRIDDWNIINFHYGYFNDARTLDCLNLCIATRPGNLRQTIPGLEELSASADRALEEVKTGALIGPAILRELGWRVGQKFTLVGVSPLRPNIPMTVVGTLPEGRWYRGLVFRDDYYQSATGNREEIDMMWIKVRNPQTGQRLAAELERAYERSQPEIKVESESAGLGRFVGRNQMLLSLMKAVVFVLLVDIVLVLSNSISLATRERHQEMATLKVLGFRPRHIVALVVGESIVISATGGLLGAGLLYGLSVLNGIGNFRLTEELFSAVPIAYDVIPGGILLGVLIGIAGSLGPALKARKVRIADVFARVE